MDYYDEEFSKLRPELKEWVLSIVKKGGSNPLGESYLRNTNIYKITYSLSENGKPMFLFTGQMRAVSSVRFEIVQIFYDWVSSQEAGAPVHIVLARKEGEQATFVYDVIVTNKYSITCHPPKD
jgi:hypothetical protein